MSPERKKKLTRQAADSNTVHSQVNYLNQCDYINRLIYYIDKIYITIVFCQLLQIREFSQSKQKRIYGLAIGLLTYSSVKKRH